MLPSRLVLWDWDPNVSDFENQIVGKCTLRAGRPLIDVSGSLVGWTTRENQRLYKYDIGRGNRAQKRVAQTRIGHGVGIQLL